MLLNTSKDFIYDSSESSAEWRMVLKSLREMKTLHEIENMNSNSKTNWPKYVISFCNAII